VTHRVALYTVHVRRKRDNRRDFLPLGDIDENGTSLAMVLASYLADDFEAVNDEKTRSLRCEAVDAAGIDLFAMFRHGQTGVAADIVDKRGELRLRQSPDDTQRVRCGALLRLPPAGDMGWLAAHINNGRSVKGLMEKEIQARFRSDFPRLVLEIKPFVLGSVLLAAVEQDRIDSVKLIRWDHPSDRAAGTGKWVSGGMAAKVELSIKPRGQMKRLLSRLPLQFLHGDSDVFGEIVQFEGLTFDEAKLEVTLDDGTRRTFNIEHPDAGHAFTEDLGELRLEDGEPTVASLREGLRRALLSVAG
jgi:hypothetical protein